MHNERFDKGVELFNSGRYHEAHDEWEVPWKALPECADKYLFKGLIMVAASLHHYKKKEYAGTAKLLKRAFEVLEGAKSHSMDMDLPSFLSDVGLFAKMFERSGDIIGELPKIRRRK